MQILIGIIVFFIIVLSLTVYYFKFTTSGKIKEAKSNLEKTLLQKAQADVIIEEDRLQTEINDKLKDLQNSKTETEK